MGQLGAEANGSFVIEDAGVFKSGVWERRLEAPIYESMERIEGAIFQEV
jgi:hypothetical protein